MKIAINNSKKALKKLVEQGNKRNINLGLNTGNE
jgi:hypothetical protein